MNIKAYIREKGIFLIVNIFMYLTITSLLFLLKVQLAFIVLLSCAWFLPLFTSYCIDYFKKRNYYNSLLDNLESLDKKYLLSEVMEEPSFLEGKILYDIVKTTDKDMHEHVRFYKNAQIEYREYIETWVHEIKTPISSGKLILENNKNEVSKMLSDELSQVELLVEQALYYARSSDASKDYIVKEFSLQTSVRSVVKKNAKSFIHKKIQLDLAEINEVVFSDSMWVEFIINQILINAINYSEKDHATIKIFSTKQENSLVLHIVDNGIGIEAKDLQRVFEKGFTGDNGRVYRKSTGIGLYLCKKLAEKLHLGIEIQSEKNVGTEVRIIFPRSKVVLLES